MNDKQREAIKKMNAETLLDLFASYIIRGYNLTATDEDYEICNALRKEIEGRLTNVR